MEVQLNRFYKMVIRNVLRMLFIYLFINSVVSKLHSISFIYILPRLFAQYYVLAPAAMVRQILSTVAKNPNSAEHFVHEKDTLQTESDCFF